MVRRSNKWISEFEWRYYVMDGHMRQSMRNNPDKYTSLNCYNNQNSLSSSKDKSNLLHMSSRQLLPPPYDYYVIEDYISIVLEEAEKLYSVLVHQLVCGVVNENAAISIAALPPALPLEGGNNNQQEHLE
ncbi:MAG: hypothetical protein ACJ72F_04030 [Nitrososphaeraceae archaeon]